MRVVAALGGNALLRAGETPTATVQRRHARDAARALAAIATDHELVVTHGNGPQIGLLAFEQAVCEGEPYPLDALGAETEGLIGYWVEQELTNALGGHDVVALLTRVIVDAEDPAFARPTKPIGRRYDRVSGQAVAETRGWTMAPDGDGLRRVVASPEPRSVIETQAIRRLVDAGIVVVCGGGGGVPVQVDRDGALTGVEAVVDKDLTAALLARALDADVLVLLTDVDGVRRHFGTPHETRVDQATPAELRVLGLPEGSMGPKVEACARFAATGGTAIIAALEDAAAALAGQAGTRVLADAELAAHAD